MAGFIGARASVVSSGAERKQTYAITTTTTSLTGLAYTPTKVHVYHNGIRLVDGTDYTATDGSSITLTTAAENGDEVVVISYATFQTSDTVSAANGGTFAGNVTHTGTLTASGALNTGTILPSTDNASDLGSTSKRFQDLHLSGGVSFDEDPSLVTGSVSGKTLDDYEEGTFTASLDAASLTGYYTKVGNLCYFTIWGTDTNDSANSITGLPFTSGTFNYAGVLNFGRSRGVDWYDANGVPCRAYVHNSSTTITFRTNAISADDASFTITTNAVSDWAISGVYQTT